MNRKLVSKETDDLYKAFSLIGSREEFYVFIEDLCTVAEIKSLSQRFNVALMLSEGMTYSEVSEKTGASTATISRISKCLSYGADGYNTIIKRFKSNEV